MSQRLILLGCAPIFVLFTVFAGTADELKAPPAKSRDKDLPAAVLSTLQAAHSADQNTFVPQGDLDCLIREGGGGACASAAAIDLLQSLRLMARLEKLPNPQKVVLASFADQRELLDGRVTNVQFVRLMKFYEGYLEGAKLNIDVISAPDSGYASDGQIWSASKGPDLDTRAGEVKILSYTVTDSMGKVPGRHFVLLKDREDNTLHVVDPRNPSKDRRYVIEFQMGIRGPRQRLIFKQPPEAPPRKEIFELNTIFNISLIKQAAEPSLNTGKATSIEEVKIQINRVASDLRGTENFFSPRAWRKRTAGFGLPGLDLPVAYGGPTGPHRRCSKYSGMLGDIISTCETWLAVPMCGRSLSRSPRKC